MDPHEEDAAGCSRAQLVLYERSRILGTNYLCKIPHTFQDMQVLTVTY